jgi:hypothetical protein
MLIELSIIYIGNTSVSTRIIARIATRIIAARIVAIIARLLLVYR